MTPATAAFTTRTVITFAELLHISTEQLGAAGLAVEAGELGQAADQLRAAADLAVQVAGGARTLAEMLNAEARGESRP